MNINFYRLAKVQKYLKIVLDKNLLTNENEFLDKLASKLTDNVDILQVDNINLEVSEYVSILQKIKLLCGELNTIFIVSDRCDIATFLNTDGILIPQNGLDISFCRHLLGKEKIIGIEIEEQEEITNINSEVDYIILKNDKLENQIKILNIPYFTATKPFQGNNLVYLYRTNP